MQPSFRWRWSAWGSSPTDRASGWRTAGAERPAGRWASWAATAEPRNPGAPPVSRREDPHWRQPEEELRCAPGYPALPSSRPPQPQALPEPQSLYRATAVKWRRASSPEVWTCTCRTEPASVRVSTFFILRLLITEPQILYSKLKQTPPTPDSPQVRRDAVVLCSPRRGVVDGLAVHLQPLTHLPQALLKDRSDSAVVRGPDVHEEVPSTGHGLHQSLTPTTNTERHACSLLVVMCIKYSVRFI